jgi:hypothetical protein
VAIWRSSSQTLTCRRFWSAVRNRIRPDARLRISTSTQLREILCTDSQGILVLLFIVASHYCNCCIDGSTSPENYGYHLVCNGVLSTGESSYKSIDGPVYGTCWICMKAGLMATLPILWKLYWRMYCVCVCIYIYICVCVCLCICQVSLFQTQALLFELLIHKTRKLAFCFEKQTALSLGPFKSLDRNIKLCVLRKYKLWDESFHCAANIRYVATVLFF